MASLLDFEDNLYGKPSSSPGLPEELGLGAAGPVTGLRASLPASFSDLSKRDLYMGYQQFSKDYTAAGTDVTETKGAASHTGNLLDDFVDDTLKPYYSEFMGNPPEFDPKYPDTAKYLTDMDEYAAQADPSFLEGPQYKRLRLIKEKYARLNKDAARAGEAADNAYSVKEAMRKTRLSLPEQFRRAAKDWRDETPENIKPLSDNALNKMLDKVKFDDPVYDSLGILVNSERIDPRIDVNDATNAFGQPLDPLRKERQAEKLTSYRNQTTKKIMQDVRISHNQMQARKAGWLFSESGYFGGYPLYVSDAEREILDIEKLKNTPIKMYKGVPLDQAFEDLGGQERLEVAQMMETVFGAARVFEDANLKLASEIGSTAKTKKNKKTVEVARKAWDNTLMSASGMGLTGDVVKRMDKPSMLGEMLNSLDRGFLMEDLGKFSPILAVKDELPYKTIENIIATAEALEKFPRNSAYDEAMKSGPSEGMWEGMWRLFSNPAAAWNLGLESLAAYGNAFVMTAPAVIGGSTVTGAALGSTVPVPGFATGAGAAAGFTWGIRLNAGVASFMLEYTADILHGMEELGLDWRNPKVFEAAWNNPNVREELQLKSMKKTGPIAAFDMIAMGLSGRMAGVGRKIVSTQGPKILGEGLSQAVKGKKGWKTILAKMDEYDKMLPRNKMHQRLVNAGYEATGSMALGGGGEALGQVWRDPGNPLDYDAVAAEMVSEIFGPSSFGIMGTLISPKYNVLTNWGDVTKIKAEPVKGSRKENVAISLGEGREDIVATTENFVQAGWAYTKYTFNKAEDFVRFVASRDGKQGRDKIDITEGDPDYEVMKMILEIRESPTSKLLTSDEAQMDLFEQVGVHELSLVISHRTPQGFKNQRGHFKASEEIVPHPSGKEGGAVKMPGGTIFLNSSKINKTSAAWVVIHEAIHLIRPAILTKNELVDAWHELHDMDPSGDLQKTAMAHYTLKEKMPEGKKYSELSKRQQNRVDAQMAKLTEAQRAEEWFAYAVVSVMGGEKPEGLSDTASNAIDALIGELSTKEAASVLKEWAVGEGLVAGTYNKTTKDAEGVETVKEVDTPHKQVLEALAKAMDPSKIISDKPEAPISDPAPDEPEADPEDLGSEAPIEPWLPRTPGGDLPPDWLNEADLAQMAKTKEGRGTLKLLANMLGYPSWGKIPADGRKELIEMFKNASPAAVPAVPFEEAKDLGAEPEEEKPKPGAVGEKPDEPPTYEEFKEMAARGDMAEGDTQKDKPWINDMWNTASAGLGSKRRHETTNDYAAGKELGYSEDDIAFYYHFMGDPESQYKEFTSGPDGDLEPPDFAGNPKLAFEKYLKDRDAYYRGGVPAQSRFGKRGLGLEGGGPAQPWDDPAVLDRMRREQGLGEPVVEEGEMVGARISARPSKPVYTVPDETEDVPAELEPYDVPEVPEDLKEEEKKAEKAEPPRKELSKEDQEKWEKFSLEIVSELSPEDLRKWKEASEGLGLESEVGRERPRYYLSRDGKTYGPFDLDAVRKFLDENRVTLSDNAWVKGMKKWESLESVLEKEDAKTAEMDAMVDKVVKLVKTGKENHAVDLVRGIPELAKRVIANYEEGMLADWDNRVIWFRDEARRPGWLSEELEEALFSGELSGIEVTERGILGLGAGELAFGVDLKSRIETEYDLYNYRGDEVDYFIEGRWEYLDEYIGSARVTVGGFDPADHESEVALVKDLFKDDPAKLAETLKRLEQEKTTAEKGLIIFDVGPRAEETGIDVPRPDDLGSEAARVSNVKIYRPLGNDDLTIVSYNLGSESGESVSIKEIRLSTVFTKDLMDMTFEDGEFKGQAMWPPPFSRQNIEERTYTDATPEEWKEAKDMGEANSRFLFELERELGIKELSAVIPFVGGHKVIPVPVGEGDSPRLSEWEISDYLKKLEAAGDIKKEKEIVVKQPEVEPTARTRYEEPSVTREEELRQTALGVARKVGLGVPTSVERGAGGAEEREAIERIKKARISPRQPKEVVPETKKTDERIAADKRFEKAEKALDSLMATLRPENYDELSEKDQRAKDAEITRKLKTDDARIQVEYDEALDALDDVAREEAEGGEYTESRRLYEEWLESGYAGEIPEGAFNIIRNLLRSEANTPWRQSMKRVVDILIGVSREMPSIPVPTDKAVEEGVRAAGKTINHRPVSRASENLSRALKTAIPDEDERNAADAVTQVAAILRYKASLAPSSAMPGVDPFAPEVSSKAGQRVKAEVPTGEIGLVEDKPSPMFTSNEMMRQSMADEMATRLETLEAMENVLHSIERGANVPPAKAMQEMFGAGVTNMTSLRNVLLEITGIHENMRVIIDAHEDKGTDRSKSVEWQDDLYQHGIFGDMSNPGARKYETEMTDKRKGVAREGLATPSRNITEAYTYDPEFRKKVDADMKEKGKNSVYVFLTYLDKQGQYKKVTTKVTDPSDPDAKPEWVPTLVRMKDQKIEKTRENSYTVGEIVSMAVSQKNNKLKKTLLVNRFGRVLNPKFTYNAKGNAVLVRNNVPYNMREHVERALLGYERKATESSKARTTYSRTNPMALAAAHLSIIAPPSPKDPKHAVKRKKGRWSQFKRDGLPFMSLADVLLGINSGDVPGFTVSPSPRWERTSEVKVSDAKRAARAEAEAKKAEKAVAENPDVIKAKAEVDRAGEIYDKAAIVGNKEKLRAAGRYAPDGVAYFESEEDAFETGYIGVSSEKYAEIMMDSVEAHHQLDLAIIAAEKAPAKKAPAKKAPAKKAPAKKDTLETGQTTLDLGIGSDPESQERAFILSALFQSGRHDVERFMPRDEEGLGNAEDQLRVIEVMRGRAETLATPKERHEGIPSDPNTIRAAMQRRESDAPKGEELRTPQGSILMNDKPAHALLDQIARMEEDAEKFGLTGEERKPDEIKRHRKSFISIPLELRPFGGAEVRWGTPENSLEMALLMTERAAELEMMAENILTKLTPKETKKLADGYRAEAKRLQAEAAAKRKEAGKVVIHEEKETKGADEITPFHVTTGLPQEVKRREKLRVEGVSSAKSFKQNLLDEADVLTRKAKEQLKAANTVKTDRAIVGARQEAMGLKQQAANIRLWVEDTRKQAVMVHENLTGRKDHMVDKDGITRYFERPEEGVDITKLPLNFPKAAIKRDQLLDNHAFSVKEAMAGNDTLVRLTEHREMGETDLQNFTIRELVLYLLSPELGPDTLFFKPKVNILGKEMKGAPGGGLLSGYDNAGNLIHPRMSYAEETSPGVFEVNVDTILDDILVFIDENILSGSFRKNIKESLTKKVGKSKVDAYIKSNRGLLVAYYRNLIERQAVIVNSAESNKNLSGVYERTLADGTKYREWSDPGFPIFGDGKKRAKNLSEWAMKLKTMAIARRVIAEGFVTEADADRWSSYMADAPVPYDVDEETVDFETLTRNELFGSDMLTTILNNQLADAQPGAEERPLSHHFEREPDVAVPTTAQLTNENKKVRAFMDARGRTDVAQLLKDYGWTKEELDAKANEFWNVMTPKQQKAYKPGKKKDREIQEWRAGQEWLGSDPTSPYSEWSYLTSDSYTNMWNHWMAAGKRGYASFDKWWLKKHGVSFHEKWAVPFRMDMFTQFLPTRQLIERARKNLGLDHDHPLIQALDVYARQMAYFGKGARALTVASLKYYEHVAKQLRKYGISLEEFGKFLQWQATPLRNRIETMHLQRTYDYYQEQIKGIEGTLAAAPETFEVTIDKKEHKLSMEDFIEHQKSELDKVKEDLENPDITDADKNAAEEALKELSESIDGLREKRDDRNQLRKDLENLKKVQKDVDPKNYIRTENPDLDADGNAIPSPSGWTNNEAKEGLEKYMARPEFQKMIDDNDVLQRYYEMNMDTLRHGYASGMSNIEQTVRMSLANTRAATMEGKLQPLVTGGILRQDAEGDALAAKVKKIQVDMKKKGGVPPLKERNDPEGQGGDLSFWLAAFTLESAVKSKNLEAETVDLLKLGLDKMAKEELETRTASGASMFLEGYLYTPFVGFLGETSEYERAELLIEMHGKSATNRGQGFNAPRGPVNKHAKGRQGYLPPPNAELTMAQAFQAHTESIIWKEKSEIMGQVALFSDLHDFLSEFLDRLENPEIMQDLKKLYKDSGWFDGMTDKGIVRTMKEVYREFDNIFEKVSEEKAKDYFEFKDREAATVDGKVTLLPFMRRKRVLRQAMIDDPSVLIHMVKGKPKIIQFKNTQEGLNFSGSLKNAKYERMSPWLKPINPVVRLMARAYTSWNPDFMLANLFRDMGGAFLNLREDDKKAFAAKVLNFNTIRKAVLAVYRSEKNVDALAKRATEGDPALLKDFDQNPGKYLDDMDMMVEIAAISGARTGFFKHLSVSDMKNDLKKITENPEPGVIKKNIKRLGRWVDSANSGIENSVRTIAFTEAIRMGMTRQDAVMVARNVTVDFNKKGNWGTNLGAMYLFFNAGVQGNIRVMKAIANRGGKDGLKLMLGIVGTSMMWGMMQRLLAPEDEDEERSEYDDLGTWERDSNIVMFVPGGGHIKIPIPWGYSILWAFGQRLGDMMAGTSGPIEAARTFSDNAFNQLIPFGSGTSLFTLSAYEPISQMKANQKFYGAPIQKEDLPFAARKPAAYKSMPDTPWAYDSLSQWVNTILGGDSVTPGSLRTFFHKTGLTDKTKLDARLEDDLEWGMSGAMMQHFVEGYLGGIAKLITSGAQGMTSLFTGDLSIPDPKDVPVLRRFYVSETADWMTTKRFYDLRNRVLSANEYVKDLKKNHGDDAARQGMRANKKLLAIKPFVDAADTARKALLRMERKIESSKMSSEDKRHKLEEIRQKRIKATRHALAKARKLGLDV